MLCQRWRGRMNSMLNRKPMSRSGFKRPAIERPPRAPLVPVTGCRGIYAPVGGDVVAVPKGTKARPGKRTPSLEEARWMSSIVEYGCIACRLDGHEPRPTAVHHIVIGGRRMGHLFTIPLCDPGHHQNGGGLGLISRHPFKARFEHCYGTELDLLGKLKPLLGMFDHAEYTA